SRPATVRRSKAVRRDRLAARTSVPTPPRPCVECPPGSREARRGSGAESSLDAELSVLLLVSMSCTPGGRSLTIQPYPRRQLPGDFDGTRLGPRAKSVRMARGFSVSCAPAAHGRTIALPHRSAHAGAKLVPNASVTTGVYRSLSVGNGRDGL